MFQAVRGTSDLLPAQLPAYRRAEQKALDLAEKYGFQEIRTPLFEKADLFIKGLGVMAGLVERELWTFNDKHGQKLALRADMTPCVLRAYQQHRIGQAGVAKLFTLGPVFLLGKEGNEPSRQSHQFGMEVLGNDSPALDVELLVMALEYCESMGLTDVKLEINSLGCDKCRPAYFDALREFFAARQNDLCHSCKRKYRNHPTWMLSCPESSCQTLANLAPTILGYLCQDCKGHFNAIKHLLQELDLEVTFNPRVVRDLEYYNRSIFRLSAQGRTIGTGGRYDGLAQQLGGSETPAAGFSIYLDEIVPLLSAAETAPEEFDFLFLPDGPESTKALLPAAFKLRKAGARVEIIHNPQGELPAARFQVRLSEVNALRGQVDITDQETRQQEKCNVERLLNRLQHLLGQGQREEGEGRGPRRRLNRLRKERDTRRGAEEVAPAPSAVETAEDDRDLDEGDSQSDEGGRRRKRRRRRRGEGDEAPFTQDVSEAETPVETRREPRPRQEARPERAPAPPKTEQPAKAFIPSLMLGGVSLAPKPVPARTAPRQEEARPEVESTPSPSLGNLNWSIKTRASSADEEEGEFVGQGSDRPAPRRRSARRR